MSVLSLPKDPTGEQYEDLLAANLRSLGYFVETRLILKDDNKEVLELDVVATPVGAGQNARLLFEVKKEAVNFSNLFKVFGQRTYLGIESACLIGLRTVDPNYQSVYEAKGREMNVKPCHYSLGADAKEIAAPHNSLSDDVRGAVVNVGWYQEIARRIALSALLRECKNRGGAELLIAAKRYVSEVRASFFQKTALGRARHLYSAYFSTERLSGSCVKLLADENKQLEKAVWNSLGDTHEWPWVQAIMYMEGSARISIIKNAFDDFIERGGVLSSGANTKIGGFLLNDLPWNFNRGLAELRAHPYGARLPYLFQLFYDSLGGFLFQKDEEELALVETMTGVPSSEIVGSLRFFDNFLAKARACFMNTMGC